MSARRPPSRPPDNSPASGLTPDDLAARCASFRARLDEARARTRETIKEADARLPPDWLPDDEEPMLLGDVARRVVDALGDPGEAISVEVARAMLQGFGETRH